jgi:hypothetical protein
MRPGWLVGLITLFLVMQLFCCVCEMSTPLGGGEMTQLQKLMTPEWNTYNIPVLGVAIAAINVAWDYVSVIFQMLFFWYPSIFTGGWILLWAVLFLPISIGFIASMILAVVRGTPSG